MARIEKTVFISYRRADRWAALAVFKDLTQHGYDVFIDYDGIASGDFERSIVDNLKARAHFLVLLSSTALEHCNDPGDWLHREILLAIETHRNIVPLLLDGFSFSSSTSRERLQGKLEPLSRYQSVSLHEEFFDAAMERLRSKFLMVSVDAVLHPASRRAQQVARGQQEAAVKATEERPVPRPAVVSPIQQSPPSQDSRGHRFTASRPIRPGLGWSMLIVAIAIAAFVWGIDSFFLKKNFRDATTGQNLVKPTTSEPGCPLCPEMILLPGDAFKMGDRSGDGGRDERPVHNVTIKPFKLGAHEVTKDQYERFVNATQYPSGRESRAVNACSAPDPATDEPLQRTGRSWEQPGFEQSGDHPVVCVSWVDAQAFIAWLNKSSGHHFRLPSEAEWEYAAGAKDEPNGAWGAGWEGICLYANVADAAWRNSGRGANGSGANCDDGFVYTSPVGSFKPNIFGLSDIIGNVWEWTQDCFHENYVDAPRDGSAWELGGDCSRRIDRGGSWDTVPTRLRISFRSWYFSASRLNFVGFRLAEDP
jgi:formylglycine-generating enzyme